MDKTNPKHYRDAAITLEPIDLCELLGFNLGNAVKYIVRAGHKDGESEADDLMKAMFYLDREEFDRAERALAAYKAQIMSKAELIAEAIAQVRMAKEREVFQWTGG